jgi:hypothetical protein
MGAPVTDAERCAERTDNLRSFRHQQPEAEPPLKQGPDTWIQRYAAGQDNR